ncbi:MAG: DNA topoisomerase IV subunit B [Actinomycetaceae bacterium]|nr:DNA topoisomerase IV subunit B [Actinomycetaceae bacterium]
MAKTASTSQRETYTARHLSVLEGLEAVRKRPGMYIGSTDQRGLMHCLWEIIDNGVDEALEGHCSTIAVTIHPDHSVSVSDDGRGIPVDTVESLGLSGVEVVFTKLHAGGKFGNGSYSSSGGLHGVGASVVNALSARLDVEVDRDGKTYMMSFRRGEPGVFDDSNGRTPNSPFTAFTDSSQLRVINKIPRNKTGTRVRFWADFQIFPATEGFSCKLLVDRCRQTSFLVPGLTLTVVDEREDTQEEVNSTLGDYPTFTEGDTHAVALKEQNNNHRVYSFRHDGGVVDFVDFLAPDQAVTDIWHFSDTRTYTETVQTLNEKTHHMEAVETERKCHIDIALRWGIGYETTHRSFVNIVATPKGGTHVAGFEQALVKTMRSQVKKNSRRLKLGNKQLKLEKDDILAGLTSVVTVRVPEPQFEGQTKEILGTPQVRAAVASVVSEGLDTVFDSKKRDDKQQVFQVLEKVVGEMRARISARMHKEISRRKNALETSSLPAKLADCRTKTPQGSELFIVEGDSALGTAKKARSAEFQALFPIRGKILNVQKASTSDMLSNAECAAIIQVIGAGSGRTFDLEQARYEKIIMMTDADVDGAHIRTLLLTLFFRYMRPLVEAGRVYAAVPPLHRVEVNAKGRKKRELVYTYSQEELEDLLKRLQRSGRTYKEPIQRYKGLGEMDAHQLAETTMDPQMRSLRRITLEDEQALIEAQEMFELLMGSTVAPRKEFIVRGAKQLDESRIDA